MFSVFWQHWLQRPSRFVLTLLSLVLSTATLISIFVASHNARSSFRDLINAVQGLPSLDVVAAQGGRFEFDGKADARPVPTIEVNLPMLIRGSVLRNKEAKARGLVIGIPMQDRQSDSTSFVRRQFMLDEDQWPKPDECICSSIVAGQLKVDEGDSIQCLFRRGFRKLVVRKIVPSEIWNRICGEQGLMVDLEWLQTATALPHQIDRNRFFLRSNSESDKVAASNYLNKELPSHLKIQERTNTIGVADDLLKSTELGLSFASALAVAMAAYILLNTTRMNLAERRPHFAILKCIGATNKQIQRAVLFEAAIMSAIGVSLGILIGCALGAWMGGVLASIMQARPGTFGIPWAMVTISSVALPIITILVVWFAIKKQEDVSPLESFREPPVASEHSLPWMSIGNGIFLWCIAMFGMYCVHREWVSPQWGVVAGLLSLLAYLLWVPLGLVPLVWLIGRIAKQRYGFPIEIAKNQLTLRPERTTLNAGFLVIALCGAVGLGQVVMSNTAEILRWYHRTLPGDVFLISTQAPSLVIDSEDPLREAIAGLPGLKWANPMRFFRCTVDELPVMGIVREFPDQAPFPTEPKGMSLEEAKRTIQGDCLFLASILAKKLGKVAGDKVVVSFNGRSFPVEVGGVNANFANGGMAFIMNRTTAQKYMEVTGFEWYALAFDQHQLDAARTALMDLKQQHLFEIQMGDNMRRGVEQTIGGVTAGVWTVVFISFLTGGFGIATTLAMNMIEQARDFSLLRIVGASRWQTMLTVLAQAWLLGIIGIFFGMIGGVTTVIIIWSCSEALLGYTTELVWDPTLMVGAALGTLAIVTLAAVMPAWRAATINPIEHLSYE